MPNSLDFTIVDVNNAFLLFFNLKREALVGSFFLKSSLNNPAYLFPGWNAALKKVVRNKKPFKLQSHQYKRSENRVLHSKIRYLEVLITPILNDQDTVEYILCSVADVTVAVNSKSLNDLTLEKLQKNEKLLKESQAVSGIGTWDIDLSNNKVTWSDQLKEIHEVDKSYRPELGSIINFYKANGNSAMIAQIIEDARNNGNIIDVELNLKTAKGNEKLVRTKGRLEINEEKCVRLYGTTQIISEYNSIAMACVKPNNLFQSLLNKAGVIVWEADAQTFEGTFISAHVKEVLGYSAEEWMADQYFWQNHIHPDDRESVLQYCITEINKSRDFTFDYRMAKADGGYVWMKDIASVVTENGIPKLLRGFMVDITDTKRLNEIEFLEKNILELNRVKGTPVQEVLSAYLAGIESIFPKMKLAIFQVKNNRLYKWAASRLPENYLIAVESVPINKIESSSGACAFLKQNIIIDDIENDPRWSRRRKMMLKAHIKACWSYPIMNAENEVMATFGVYYPDAIAPNDDECKMMERIIAFLKVILENRRNLEVLLETNKLMVQCQDLAQFGVWSWDLINNTVTWSDTIYTIFGLDKQTFKATFQAYLDLLHLDDTERVSVLMGSVLSTKKEVKFEERIVRPNAEVRHLMTSVKIILDNTGMAINLIGACMDVTESKIIQEKLLISEGRLRSLVDAQTNYVVRIDFQGKFTYCNAKYIQNFGWIFEQQDLIGQDSIKTVFPKYYPKLFELAESCMNQPHTIYEVELETPTPDGGLKFVLWQFMCLTDTNGLPTEMQGIGVNITEQKLAKDALLIASERNKYVGLITNDAIYDWDLVEDRILWGDGYYRLFNYENSKKKYPLSSWVSQIHFDDVKRIEKQLKEVLEDKTMNKWKAEYQFKKGNGQYAYIEEIGYIIRDLDGKGIRMIGAMRDIEERKKAADEIKFLHQQLVGLNNTSWIPSNVAQATLTKIIKLVESIESRASSENEKAQLLDILKNSVNHLSRFLMCI